MNIRIYSMMIAATLMMSAGAAHAAEAIGVVGALNGNATATSKAGDARALNVGDAIHRDDVLATAAGSKMQIMLEDQSTITLNPNSTLSVSEFAFDAEANDGSIQMNALKGAFRFIGGAVSKNREAKIKTPVSSIGIRGSIGDTSVAAGGQTEAVFVSGGQMSMTNAGGETTTTTEFGTGFSMQTPNDTPQPMTNAQVDALSAGFTSPTPTTSTGGGGTTGGDDAAGTTGTGGDGSGDGDGDAGDSADAGTSGDSSNTGSGDASTTSEVATENQRVETVTALAGGNENVFNDPESARATIQQNIDNGVDASGNGGTANGGTTNGGTTDPTTLGGLLAALDYDATVGAEDVLFDAIGELLNLSRSGDTVSGDELELQGANAGTTSQFTAQLPPVGTAGFFDFNPGGPTDFLTIGTDAFKARSFSSDSGNFTYVTYDMVGINVSGNSFTPLSGSDIGEEIKFFIGREVNAGEEAQAVAATIAESIANGTGNISYYGFLPDLNNHTAAGFGLAGADGVGIFNFGYIDHDNGAASDTDNLQLSNADGNFGVAVNWETEQFFSGFVRWGAIDGSAQTASNANEDFVTIAFGDVDTTGGANVFDGNGYTFSGDTKGSLLIDESGLNSTTSNVFRDENNVLEAIVLGGDIGNTGNNSDTLIQPGLLLDLGGTPPTNTQTGGATTYVGYSAGFQVLNVDGGPPAILSVGNTDLSDVSITTNDGANRTEATISVKETANIYTYEFGGAQGDSVFLSDDLYAAELHSAKNENGGLIYDVPNDTTSNTGFIANADAINDSAATNAVNECTTCDYVHWGVWSASSDLNGAASGAVNEINTTALMPYVAGTPTTAAELTSFIGGATNSVNYTGEVLGNVYDGTNISQESGGFTAVINLGTRTIDDFTGTLGAFGITSTGTVAIATTGAAELTGPLSISLSDGGINMSGTLNGALFGPAAENIGGNFNAGDGGANLANGVYLGAR